MQVETADLPEDIHDARCELEDIVHVVNMTATMIRHVDELFDSPVPLGREVTSSTVRSKGTCPVPASRYHGITVSRAGDAFHSFAMLGRPAHIPRRTYCIVICLLTYLRACHLLREGLASATVSKFEAPLKKTRSHTSVTGESASGKANI